MTDQTKPYVFNPNDHLIQIKTRGSSADYLPCQWRLVWVNSDEPQELEITIVDEQIDLDRETEEETFAWNSDTRRSEKVVKCAPGWAKYRVRVRVVTTDGRKLTAEGVKSEKAASFGDFIEKAATGALGRALAMIGYGTQFTGEEFDEKHRILDAPVDRGTSGWQEHTDPQPQADSSPPVRQPAASNPRRPSANQPALPARPHSPDRPAQLSPEQQGPMTEQQRASIQKLYQHLGKSEPPAEMTYLAAKELIAQLSQEYRQSRKAS